jgi:hypothetical protein
MASANLTVRMKHAIANEELSLEILKRVSVTSAPANAAAAQAVLASLDESKNEKIAEWCKVAFAGDGKAGDEIAKKVVKMMEFTDADIQENMKYKMKESGQLEGGEGGQESGGQEDFGEPSGPGADFFNKSESQPSEMGGEAQVGGEISGEAPTEPTPQTQAPAQETPTQTQ